MLHRFFPCVLHRYVKKYYFQNIVRYGTVIYTYYYINYTLYILRMYREYYNKKINKKKKRKKKLNKKKRKKEKTNKKVFED